MSFAGLRRGAEGATRGLPRHASPDAALRASSSLRSCLRGGPVPAWRLPEGPRGARGDRGSRVRPPAPPPVASPPGTSDGRPRALVPGSPPGAAPRCRGGRLAPQPPLQLSPPLWSPRPAPAACTLAGNIDCSHIRPHICKRRRVTVGAWTVGRPPPFPGGLSRRHTVMVSRRTSHGAGPSRATQPRDLETPEDLSPARACDLFPPTLPSALPSTPVRRGVGRPCRGCSSS